MLKGRKPTAATLVKRRDGGYFLHVQIKDEAPDPIETKGHIGVDLGIKNLATTDDGENFSGDDVETCRRDTTGSARPASGPAPRGPSGSSARPA